MIFYPDSEKVKKILNRGELFEDKYLSDVIDIIQKVKKEGDNALIELTKKFDNYNLEKKYYFERSELKTFYDKIPENLKVAFNRAKDNIEFFHYAQMEKTFLLERDEAILGQKITPLEKVGIYVPGGKASYPSTVLMNAVPAKVAGVDKILMMSPTSGGEINELVLGVAYLAGVDKVYLVGGAQAIAALAYGTETVEKVDKIVGPGNIYVALAKKIVFGTVDIDMVAGPSEILILADDTANPAFIAADMLSQAEHDELASAITITDNEDLAKAIEKELFAQLSQLERRNVAEKSLREFGGILLVKNLEEGVNFVNNIAPEHFELCVRNPFEYLYKIKNAGAIFLGHYTPEAVGDYFAGPNHTLPTGGSARFFSPLGTYDFIKRSSIIQCSLNYLKKFGNNIMDMADSEGLTAHRNTIKYRMLDGFKEDI
ncbi:histidinol dehydrogenase [Deferribacter abyssi]|uniref:histidinol dehydrogenase n=1 Tax=Deferribacter abyssi TaxID=213806 RepID=UPI003C1C5CAF